MAVAAKMMHAGAVALALTALSACGAPPAADTAASNNVVVAPEDVLAESNASIMHDGDESLANLTAEVAPPTRDEAAAATIPARFHGRWDSSREACARTSSEMRLVVAPDSLRFYESVGQVTGVRSADDTVAVDLRTSGEGETRTETRALRLDGDGRLVVQSGDNSAVRVRCPA